METVFLGLLPEGEPLHTYLRELLGLPRAVFESYRLHPQRLLVGYRDRESGRKVACKFFGRKHPTEGEVADDSYYRNLLSKEVQALEDIRSLGFDRSPQRVPMTLGRNEELEFLLVEEFVDGPHLDEYLRRAYKQLQDRPPLQGCLRLLGDFLGKLHRRSVGGLVDPTALTQPLNKYLGHLRERNIDEVPESLLRRLEEVARVGPDCARVSATLLHGDCTPVNFIFPSESEMVAIDLERCHRADPMRDLGAMEAELRLAAIAMAGDVKFCEPEVQVLRDAYGTFDKDRLRFWVGTTLVRISRNDWHKPGERPQILEEALRCLSH
jgi:tRNA A-37 threonylcarbamoyl transferase component Bud32